MMKNSAESLRRLVLALGLLIAIPGMARAQLGFIIVPKEPEEARVLAAKAEKLLGKVKAALRTRTLKEQTRSRVVALARKLAKDAKVIYRNAMTGIPLSYKEEASIKKDLRRVRDICLKLVQKFSSAESGGTAAAPAAAADPQS